MRGIAKKCVGIFYRILVNIIDLRSKQRRELLIDKNRIKSQTGEGDGEVANDVRK